LQDIALLQNCYIRLSDTYVDTGDPVSALEGYKHELHLAERRASEFPGDNSQYTLAMSQARVPEAMISLGNATEAAPFYQKSLTLLDGLLAKQPAEPRFLRARMISLIWMGNISGNPRFINHGETQAALQYYQQAFALAEQLCAIDPKNARAQQDLAGGHRLMAEILALTQPAKAVVEFQKALSIVHDLLAIDPKEAQLLRRKGQYLRGLGDALQRLGDRQGALQNLQQARQVWQELWDRDTSNLKTRAELHATLLLLAEALLKSGDHNGSLEQYRQALTLAETPSVEQSADLYVRWRLADSFAGLSHYYATRAKAASAAERHALWQEARQYAQQSLALWEGWAQHAASSNFDRHRREQAIQTLATCDAALAKFGH